MPREGIFARVLQGGMAQVGDSLIILKAATGKALAP
jgi:hypothetical protein